MITPLGEFMGYEVAWEPTGIDTAPVRSFVRKQMKKGEWWGAWKPLSVLVDTQADAWQLAVEWIQYEILVIEHNRKIGYIVQGEELLALLKSLDKLFINADWFTVEHYLS